MCIYTYICLCMYVYVYSQYLEATFYKRMTLWSLRLPTSDEKGSQNALTSQFPSLIRKTYVLREQTSDVSLIQS